MEGAPQLPENKEEILHPGISSELLKMAEEDQKMRLGLKDGGEWDHNLDSRNTERMKVIISEIGWPNTSKVGKEASHMAWLLAQHADHDPAFQRKCLELIKNEPSVGMDLRDIGYLEDRVRVNTQNLQLYGTQFYTNEEGTFGPRPIEDPEHLNERREAILLGPFEEYRDHMCEVNKEYEEGQRKRDSAKKS